MKRTLLGPQKPMLQAEDASLRAETWLVFPDQVKYTLMYVVYQLVYSIYYTAFVLIRAPLKNNYSPGGRLLLERKESAKTLDCAILRVAPSI